jgi:hypothetical protein
MKFKITGFLCFLSMTALPQQFSRIYDFFGYDGNDRGVIVLVEDDGFTIVSASFCIYPKGCPGVKKVNKTGDLLWEINFDQFDFNFGPTFRDGLLKVAEDEYLLLGTATYDYVEFDITLIRFRSDGTVLWTRHYDYGENTYGFSLKAVPGGGYVIYGERRLDEKLVVWLIRLDENADVLWEKIIENPDSRREDRGNLEVLPNGDMVSAFNIWNPWANVSSAGIVRLDPEGEVIWQHNFPFGWINNQCQRIIRPLPDGNFALTNCTDTITSPGNPSIGNMVSGLSPEGEVLWNTVFYSWVYKEMANIRVTANGDIIGCGADANFPGTGAWSAWVFRMSAEGELLWERRFIRPPFQDVIAWFDDLAETPDGNIAVLGTTLDTFPDGFIHGDAWLLVLDENGCLTPGCTEVDLVVSAEDLIPLTGRPGRLAVYPNPAGEILTIVLPQGIQRKNSRLRLFSTSGQVVREEWVAEGRRSVEWHTAGLPPGMYVVALEVEGRVYGREKIVIK